MRAHRATAAPFAASTFVRHHACGTMTRVGSRGIKCVLYLSEDLSGLRGLKPRKNGAGNAFCAHSDSDTALQFLQHGFKPLIGAGFPIS